MYKIMLFTFFMGVSACNFNTALFSPEHDLELAYVTVDPAQEGSKYDYVVQSKTNLFFSYSMKDRAAREKYLRKLFYYECQDIKILSESEFVYGRFVNGNDNKQYRMNVMCFPS